MNPRRWLWFGACSAALSALAWQVCRERVPPGVLPEVARAVRQLQAHEPLYHRTLGRLVQRTVPALAAQFPRVLGVESQVPRQRLEACHALIAWGPAAAPALPLLVEAFCDSDPDVRVYAFLSLVHLEVPAGEVAALVRERSRDPAAQLRHCVGLLADEDETVRDFAKKLVQAFAPTEAEGDRALQRVSRAR